MIKINESLLMTGSKTVGEFVAAFYDRKSVRYNTSNIRKEFCDKCSDVFNTCKGCFIHEGLQAIYKVDPLA